MWISFVWYWTSYFKLFFFFADVFLLCEQSSVTNSMAKSYVFSPQIFFAIIRSSVMGVIIHILNWMCS